MKVAEPYFGKFTTGEVYCRHCPLDEEGAQTGIQKAKLCDQWHRDHDDICPQKETYQAACELAEAKGER